MEMVETRLENAFMIALRGRLDSLTAPTFEPHLLNRLDEQPCLVLSFLDLSYISSAGLRILLVAAKKAKKLNRRLILCDMSDAVREVFAISGFLSILNVHNSLDDALAAASQPTS